MADTGNSFGSVFLLFLVKVARGNAHRSWRKSPGPGHLWKPCWSKMGCPYMYSEHFPKRRRIFQMLEIFQLRGVARGGSKGDTVVRALTSHQCGLGSNPRCWSHMWVEFVVGALLCSEGFFSRYSGFPLSLKTNISKFQFDLERTDTFQWVLKNCWVLRR